MAFIFPHVVCLTGVGSVTSTNSVTLVRGPAGIAEKNIQWGWAVPPQRQSMHCRCPILSTVNVARRFTDETETGPPV